GPGRGPPGRCGPARSGGWASRPGGPGRWARGGRGRRHSPDQYDEAGITAGVRKRTDREAVAGPRGKKTGFGWSNGAGGDSGTDDGSPEIRCRSEGGVMTITADDHRHGRRKRRVPACPARRRVRPERDLPRFTQLVAEVLAGQRDPEQLRPWLSEG